MRAELKVWGKEQGASQAGGGSLCCLVKGDRMSSDIYSLDLEEKWHAMEERFREECQITKILGIHESVIFESKRRIAQKKTGTLLKRGEPKQSVVIKAGRFVISMIFCPFLAATYSTAARRRRNSCLEEKCPCPVTPPRKIHVPSLVEYAGRRMPHTKAADVCTDSNTVLEKQYKTLLTLSDMLRHRHVESRRKSYIELDSGFFIHLSFISACIVLYLVGDLLIEGLFGERKGLGGVVSKVFSL